MGAGWGGSGGDGESAAVSDLLSMRRHLYMQGTMSSGHLVLGSGFRVVLPPKFTC